MAVNLPQTPSAPNLPFATVQYEQRYLDQLNNILRLYFNQLDSAFSSLFSVAGFLLTFTSDKDRNDYLVHPAHKEFGKILGPYLDKVTVVDFWVK